MRLGDLDDLKVHISELMLVYSGEELDNAILDAIDNALTVNAIPNDESYEIYSKGYLQGYKRGNSERPQGEWVFDSEFKEFGNPYGTYRCSICGCHSSNTYSFCKDCGADMRGGVK